MPDLEIHYIIELSAVRTIVIRNSIRAFAIGLYETRNSTGKEKLRIIYSHV